MPAISRPSKKPPSNAAVKKKPRVTKRPLRGVEEWDDASDVPAAPVEDALIVAPAELEELTVAELEDYRLGVADRICHLSTEVENMADLSTLLHEVGDFAERDRLWDQIVAFLERVTDLVETYGEIKRRIRAHE